MAGYDLNCEVAIRVVVRASALLSVSKLRTISANPHPKLHVSVRRGIDGGTNALSYKSHWNLVDAYTGPHLSPVITNHHIRYGKELRRKVA